VAAPACIPCAAGDSSSLDDGEGSMDAQQSEQVFLGRVTSGTIRVVLLAAWIVWCLQIVLPFVIPILWGAIIATAVFPLVRRLSPKRPTLGGVCFGVLGITLIIVPSWLFLSSVGEFAVGVGREWTQGKLEIPPPRPEVAEWPLIGKRLYALWTELVAAPASVVENYLPQLRQIGRWLMQSLGSLTLGVLESLFAIAVASAFIAKADATERALVPVAERIAPEYGQPLLELAKDTVRGVAKGVLGVAFLQAVLAWIGMKVAGVPAAGAWALLVLIVAVAQLPSILILGPVTVWLFMSSSTTTAVVFLVWSIIVGLIDNVVKPLVLGRGSRAPTLVIVVGAIGGMISYGIIGLFVGAVVLAVGYQLFAAWVKVSEARLSTYGAAPKPGSVPNG
jgi:predicted PurR-regulated permease PerM